MTYSNKVKASKEVLEAIIGLGNDEQIIVSYGTDYDGKPRRFRIKCFISKSSGPCYTIRTDEVWSLDSMNISSLTSTQAKAYNYDMMRQRTTYNFPLYEMKIVNE